MESYTRSKIFDIWGESSEIITGDKIPEKPQLCLFNNSIEACEMLHKHFVSNQNIAIHCDVDVDGIGSGYITKRFCDQNTRGQIRYCINKDKVHGIQEKHANFFNQYPFGLIIIVDSSQNELETIKKFHCDVLVIDHHEVQHSETSGKTEDGHDFVIVNNVLEGTKLEVIKEWLNKLGVDTNEKLEEYVPTDMMSCGLTSYELYRLYSVAYKLGPMLENMMLYQWSAVTLFTDAIQLLNNRNQWYIANTIGQQDIEPCLSVLLKQLMGNFSQVIDKQFICFKLAPYINKAIRANAGLQAMDIVMYSPSEIASLEPYAQIQQQAIEKGKQNPVVTNFYVAKDITNTGISKNYTGVIAQGLSGDYSKSCAVYTIIDGMAEGSFRGISSEVDYRQFFENHKLGNYAQGHKAAFGFKVSEDELKGILDDLETVEKAQSDKNYLTAGDMPNSLKGTYNIDDIYNFKRHGDLLRLAIGNSRVNSQEQIDIIVPVKDVRLVEQKGKLYTYNVLGLQCKGFETLKGPYARVYAEQSALLNLYIKN